MKKNFIVILLFSTIGAFAQCLTVKKVEIYGVSWNLRTHIPITIKTLKRQSDYHLVLKDNNLYDLFYDYKACKALLMSQDTIPYKRYRPSWRGKDCIACVKLFFCNGRIIKIYFRANGQYYYKGKYYKANKELYYGIFSFFSKDAVMPNGLLDEGRILYEQRKKEKYSGKN
ncbi:MAG: hypothetical protein PHI52_08800 [Bacteroidales bacterium]|nr:hypothetical protein [Bacteroidales bacterium]